MTSSILEITENEYLIKLNRSNFDLSFIRSLLKIVEVSEPTATDYINYSNIHVGMQISDRHITANQNHSSEPEYYSNLDDK